MDNVKQMKYFNETILMSIMEQLLSAIAYCHSKKICHRRLTIDNIQVSSIPGEQISIKIIDFSKAVRMNGEKLTEEVDIGKFEAPEVDSCDYDEKCDLWSCGMIMYYVISRSFPADIEKTIKKTKNNYIR